MKKPPFCFLFILLFFAGCGGGGTGTANQQITTSLQQTEPQIGFIFGRFESFDGGQASAYAIDVNSGALRFIDPEEDLYSFLSKQPDSINQQIISPNGDHSYSALTHLYHDIGHSPQDTRSADSFNHIDPGHFFLWGHQTLTQPAPSDYELETLWFCGDCAVSFGQDKALLSLTGDGARLSMTTNERQLILPLSIEGGTLRHNDNKPQLTSLPHSQDLDLSQWQATGGFFGPDAEEAGLIFSLFYDQSVFSAAGIGQKR